MFVLRLGRGCLFFDSIVNVFSLGDEVFFRDLFLSWLCLSGSEARLESSFLPSTLETEEPPSEERGTSFKSPSSASRRRCDSSQQVNEWLGPCRLDLEEVKSRGTRKSGEASVDSRSLWS